MAALIDVDVCVGCGACVEECPSGAILLDDVAVVSVDECIDCGTCVEVCPSGAVTLE
ncbi:MAG TPA: 4Fe-4S binding protein [Candidatus Acidoferrales bacterium]|nr:4Fe-4S binding protein [Candidatus Acidoferrales bacterium]